MLYGIKNQKNKIIFIKKSHTWAVHVNNFNNRFNDSGCFIADNGSLQSMNSETNRLSRQWIEINNDSCSVVFLFKCLLQIVR